MKLKLLILGAFFGLSSLSNATILDDMMNIHGKPPKNVKKIIVKSRYFEDSCFFNKEGKVDSMWISSDKVYVEYAGDTVRFSVLENRGGRVLCTQTKDSTITLIMQDGALACKVVSCNDKHLEPVIVTRYDGNGQVTSSESYKHVYDSKGRVVKSEIYDASGEKIRIITRRYDGLGIIVEKKSTDANGKLLHYVKYDTHGNPVEEKDDSQIITTKYKYDSKGNWIEKTELDPRLNSGKPVVCTKEIFYY